MLSIDDLGSYGASPDLLEAWRGQIGELTDVQERAVKAGALDGDTNLLVVAPTTSGKTFVGEMAATSSASTRRRHAIFIVPFRALAEEHYLLFRRRYGDLLSVVISTSDWTEFDADIRDGNFNLAVMTYEKLMGFLVHQPDLLERCTALVVDEVQSLSDGGRGANLELLLTQVKLLHHPPQLVALSASLDELNDLDGWLGARLVISIERPIPLTQMVCEPSGVALVAADDGSVSQEQLVSMQPDRETMLFALCEKFVDEGKQVIVFRSTIKRVEETARRLRGRMPAKGLPQSIAERLNEIDDSDALADLRICLASGVGFHNADLTHPERQIVEDAFRAGDARVLVATTTLAMGVNLPSDVVIVGDTVRHVPVSGGWRPQDISVSEYRNAAGRAGRLGQRSAGVSLLLAEDAREQQQLLQQYVLGRVEPVLSQLPRKPFADVVFEVLSAEIADDEASLVEFIASTFAYPTFYEREGGGLSAVREGVHSAVDECVATGLVVRDEGRLTPTQIARVFAAAGLSLATAVRLGRVLEQAITAAPPRQETLFEVASCTEIGDRPWLIRRRGMEQDPRPDHAPDGTGCRSDSRLRVTLGKNSITANEGKALVKARCLLEWMGGKGQRAISAQFSGMGAAPARVRDLGKGAAWLLDTLVAAGQVRGAPDGLLETLRTLALEARHGLPVALAPLSRLQVPGISREALQRLYELDPALVDPERILDADDEDVQGALTAVQLERLRAAILDDYQQSLRRREAGHLARAEQTDLQLKIVEDLYKSRGKGLEQAVADALTQVGLSATRILRQPHGEEDIQLAHGEGTIVISVTASADDARPIRWNKAKEVLGAGAGMNPVNYLCIGRPSFESLAERRALEIARETGSRSILLVPIPVLAEAIVRVAEGVMTGDHLGDLLATQGGLLSIEQLPERESVSAADPEAESVRPA